jgi:hypothetical protein
MPEKNRQSTHYLNGCTFLLNLEAITTFGENDAIKVTYVEPRNTYNSTSNGGTQRNRHDSNAADLELTFMKTDRRVHQLIQNLYNNKPPFDEFNFTIIDPLKGTVARATQVTVSDREELMWGKEGGEMKVKMRTPNFDHKFDVLP